MALKDEKLVLFHPVQGVLCKFLSQGASFLKLHVASPTRFRVLGVGRVADQAMEPNTPLA
jgi:hypothetical protein